MSISQTYRGHVIVRRETNRHEVESLGLEFPDETSAKKAVDKEVDGWVAGYDAECAKAIDRAR